jgi:hypothetical protein
MRLLRAVLAAACIGAPWCALAAEQVLDWQINGGSLPAAQRVVAVLKGDSLRWRVTSDQAGELHLHAYRLVLRVQPGKTAELAFTAHATGRFRVEWHPASADAGTGASAPAGHHAPALAVLEVRPR